MWEPYLGLELDAAYRQIATLQAQIQSGSSQPGVNVAQAINDLEARAATLSPIFTKIVTDLGKP